MLVEVPRPRFSGAPLEAADIAIDHTALSTEVARKCAGPKHVVFLDTGARSYINPEELAALKISVPLIKGYGDTAVAESTIALMWASARVLAQLDRDMRPGKWPREDGMQTLGLIGFGGIAAEVARMALGRGMRVIVWNRRARTIEHFDGISRASPSKYAKVGTAVQSMARGWLEVPISGAAR
jgi:D-3-phosphoglycerate dehydrogenase / 2-oxoglutarate reductase